MKMKFILFCMVLVLLGAFGKGFRFKPQTAGLKPSDQEKGATHLAMKPNETIVQTNSRGKGILPMPLSLVIPSRSRNYTGKNHRSSIRSLGSTRNRSFPPATYLAQYRIAPVSHSFPFMYYAVPISLRPTVPSYPPFFGTQFARPFGYPVSIPSPSTSSSGDVNNPSSSKNVVEYPSLEAKVISAAKMEAYDRDFFRYESFPVQIIRNGVLIGINHFPHGTNEFIRGPEHLVPRGFLSQSKTGNGKQQHKISIVNADSLKSSE